MNDWQFYLKIKKDLLSLEPNHDLGCPDRCLNTLLSNTDSTGTMNGASI